MPEEFAGFGIKLLYPDSWRAEQEMQGESVSLESPEGAFVSVTRFANVEDSEAALERALATMREEYDEVEKESISLQIAGFPLVGFILRFVYLDLIVTSQLLVFTHEQHTYFIQIQAEDRDHERLTPVFVAVITSMCRNLIGQPPG